jgi:hypothetical protein
LRRQTVERSVAKAAIRFLGQPMGRSLHQKLKAAHEAWLASRDDAELLATIAVIADEFAKDRSQAEAGAGLTRDNLTLICFEYVTG